MPKMPGRGLSDKVDDDFLSDQERVEVARLQARMLHETQKHKTDVSGKYYPLENKFMPFKDGYVDYIESEILRRLSKAQSYNENTKEDDIKWVREKLSRSRGAMELDFRPSIVYQDFKPANMNIDRENGKLFISGIFDLMESYSGNGESDLSRMYAVYTENDRLDLAQAFKDEYLKGDVKQEGFDERFLVFMLYDRAIIWDWKQRPGNDSEEGVSFKEWVQKYLE